MFIYLLIIAKEDLDWEPIVTADLEAVLEVVQLHDFLVGQAPSIDLEVGIDTGLADRLGNNTPALLQTPHKEYLLGCLALLFSQLQERRVLVERRVGGSQAGVAGRVDALGRVVGDELGRWVVGVQFDLVDSRDDLGAGIVQEDLKVLNAEVRDTDVADLAGGWELLHLLPIIWLILSNHDLMRMNRCNVPCLDEVPVRKVLLLIIGVGRAGPVDEV